MEMLQAASSGMPQERAQLCEFLEQYITKQVDHMNHEEANVYPEIESALSDQEWLEINTELKNIDDPLFGRNIKKAYQALYQQVVNG